MVYVARLWQILRETTFLSGDPRDAASDCDHMSSHYGRKSSPEYFFAVFLPKRVFYSRSLCAPPEIDRNPGDLIRLPAASIQVPQATRRSPDPRACAEYRR